MSGRAKNSASSVAALWPFSGSGTARRRAWCSLSQPVLFSAVLGAISVFWGSAQPTQAQERRDREPNSVYSARRAKLAAEADAPILLWGFTGREEFSQAYIFRQEDNFYYLTGHNEEGAGLILLPGPRGNQGSAPVSKRKHVSLLYKLGR